MSRYHLGVNMGHDRAAALVRDGEIVVAIEVSRYTIQELETKTTPTCLSSYIGQ